MKDFFIIQIMEQLGDQFKAFESKIECVIPASEGFIIRIDGNRFSKFCKDMNKPFDVRLHNCLIRATTDSMARFHAHLAFQQSDEISFLFLPTNGDTDSSQHQYKGRVVKLCSLIASFFSVRFNFHLRSENWDVDKFERQSAHFDARLAAQADSNNLSVLLDNICWRFYDCKKNAVSAIAQTLFKHSELEKKHTTNKLEMIRSKGLDPFKDYSPFLLYGTFINRIQVEKDGFNPTTGETVKCNRFQLQIRNGEFFEKMSTKERLKFILANIRVADIQS